MNIDFQKSRHIWQKKRFNRDRLSFAWQKPFIQSLKICYMIDVPYLAYAIQNLKTSNTMLKHCFAHGPTNVCAPAKYGTKTEQIYKRIGFCFYQFHTCKKKFLFKISTIRTNNSPDIRFSPAWHDIVFSKEQGSKDLSGATLIRKNYKYCLKRHWHCAATFWPEGRPEGRPGGHHKVKVPPTEGATRQRGDKNEAMTISSLRDKNETNIRTKVFNQIYSLAKNLGFTLRTNAQIEIATVKAGRAKIVETMNQISKDWIFQSKTKGNAVRSILYIKKREHYLQKSDQIFQNLWFQNYEKSNQNTYFYQRPISYPLQWIQKGDLLGDCAASTQGELALGKNLLVAYMPWEGFNFEDAVLINNKILSTYTSLHIEKYDLEISEFEKITNHIPGIPKKNLLKLDKNGIVQIGSWVQEGDILVGKIIPIASETQTLLTHEKLLYDLVGQKDIQIQERCLRVPQGSSGRIIRISYTYLKTEQNQKNSFPLSESSLTKLKTKVQTGPKLTLAKTFINKVKQTQPLVFPLPSEASYLADWQLHSKAMGTKKFSQTSPEGRPKVRGEGMSRPVPWGDLLGDLLVVPIRDETTRSFFPFFIQNLHYSYFIRKSFRHFCQSNLCWTNILEKTPGRTKTGSNDRLTVFKKMYNNRQTDSRCQQQNGHRETLPAAVWAKQTAQSKVSHRRDTRTGGSNISSYLNKNKKFVTIISRWLWLYKSLVTKNNYLFTEVGQCPISLHAKRYLHQRIFPGEKKTRFLNQTLIAHRQIQAFKWGNKDFSLTKRFNNFISINQRNFQKIVFEKPNEPIQIPKIIPRISTILDRKVYCLQTFQKNQNRLRQQSQKKLLRTPLYAVSTQKRRALYREPEGRPEGHRKERDKNLVSYGIQFKNIWNSVPFFALAKARDINQLPHSPMGPSLPLKAFKKITIYIAEKREFQVGDKISGRHGNKGIISQIFSNYDMPYLVSGDTLDVLLNPLGVPSRMNVGQILECLLGFTGQIFHTKFQILCFDEIYGYEASRSFIYSKIFELCQKMRQKWLFSKKTPGKLNIFDGRNGQLFHQSVMVGSTYLMKLIHIVDEKIHARGTGPYSLITQQPLRGRAKHGGQRFGEMEVWALQGFGSAYTLQELLTVKSDDLQGRNQIMQTLLKNTPLRFGTPESLRVVLRELQCLCLDLQLSTTHHKVIRQFPGEK